MSGKVEEKEKKADAEVTKEFVAGEKREQAGRGGRGNFQRESREERFAREAKEKLDAWVPKTQLGRDVRSGKIKTIGEIFSSGKKIMESQIVDLLLKNLKTDLLFIGQAKGKFGGGKRRAWRQTQKKTQEGNVLTFGVMAVVGDGHGHLGVGVGRASETLPAREKAVRKAKLNIQKIERGCASYDCSCNEPHSIPLVTEGKVSSVSVQLMPAPQGTGLVVGKELKKILKLAGIKDVYSKTSGKVRTTINTVAACMQALTKLGEVQV
ncbi:30S ribosomal protein S5 [Candidatus Pacearchaeota archaeon]|nr:30S ribosomal protein S5 [Candidatus Pacearchaeota archaeon]